MQTSEADPSDLLPQRAMVKTRNLARGQVTNPLKMRITFAWRQIRSARLENKDHVSTDDDISCDDSIASSESSSGSRSSPGTDQSVEADLSGRSDDDLSYMHRAKSGEPPVQTPHLRQDILFYPCACILPDGINYLNHLTLK